VNVIENERVQSTSTIMQNRTAHN